MTPDEQQLLKGLFDRVRTQAAAPRDPQAETFIADAVKALPYAPYLLTQTVLVQDHALQAANERLQQLEQKVRELEQNQSAPAGGSFLGNAARSLFGEGRYGTAPAPSAPSVPQAGPWGQPSSGAAGPSYSAPPSPAWGNVPAQGAPGPWSGPQPGAWGGAPPAGGSFLHGALGAAAGVAGGVLLADSIRGLFGGGNPYGIASGFGGLGGLGGFGGSGVGGPIGGETVINNYYDANDVGAAPDQGPDVQDTGFDDSNWSNGDDSSGGSFDV